MEVGTLKQLVQGGTLIDFSIMSDSLQGLLVNLCDIISRQQESINQLREDSQQYAHKTDIELLSKEVESVNSQLCASISSVQNDLNQKHEQSTKKQKDIEAIFEEKVHDAMFAVDQKAQNLINDVQDELYRVAEMIPTIDGDIDDLKGDLDALKTKHDAIFHSSITESSETLKALTSKVLNIESDHSQQLSSLAAEVQELEITTKALGETCNDYEADISCLQKDISHFKNMDNFDRSGKIDTPSELDSIAGDTNLIRMLYRNSRRLDGFNELLAATRADSESLVQSFVEIQTSMTQMSHDIYDLSLDNGKIRAYLSERNAYYTDNIFNFEAQLSDTWLILTRMCRSNQHSFSNLATTLDQIQSILTMLSNRPLPTLMNVDDVLIELNNISDQIADKVATFEGNRERFRIPPSEAEKGPEVGKVAIKKLKGSRRESDVIESCGDNHILQKAFEELRVGLEEVKNDQSSLLTTFDKLKEATESITSRKVDEAVMDRLFDKFSALVNELRKRIEICEQNTELSLEAMKMQPSVGGKAVNGFVERKVPFRPKSAANGSPTLIRRSQNKATVQPPRVTTPKSYLSSSLVASPVFT